MIKPIHYKTPLKETLGQLINLLIKQAEVSSLLVEQQKRNILSAKEQPVICYQEMLLTIGCFRWYLQGRLTSSIQKTCHQIKIASISWKYTEERANEIVRGFLPASSESAYTIAWNFWISDLATKCTWQRLTNHAYLIKESIAAQEIKGLAV